MQLSFDMANINEVKSKIKCVSQKIIEMYHALW
jgi:hypothetical protein